MEKNEKLKSSLKNNFLIAFTLLIIVWGVFTTKVFQNNLYMILVKNNLSEFVIQNILRYFTILSTGATILATIVSIIGAYFVSKSVTEPVKKLISGVNEIAKGNLKTSIQCSGEHEIAQLADAFNIMASNLEKITISRDTLNAEIAIRKVVEDKLRKSSELFKSLIENLPIGVMIVDQDKKIVEVNSQALKLMSRSKENVVGNICHKFVCPEEHGNCPILDKGLVSDNNAEYKLICAGGEEKTILKNVIQLEIDGKNHLVEAFLDIENLKQIQKELIVEKNRAQNYLDIAGVIILALDDQANVTLINKKGCSIIGYPQEEIIGKNWIDNFIPEPARDDIRKEFLNLIGKGTDNTAEEEFVYENKILARDGKERIIRWHNTLLRDENNHIIGTLSSGNDITLSKKMEEELLKSKKLESISILAGGIAHDFNNLLTAIMGNIGLALIDDTDIKNENIIGYLKNAERASYQAKGLAQQLLTFSRGGMPIKKATDIIELVSESAKFSLKGSNIKYEFFFGDNIYNVEVDQTQISQVIHNLIINAQQSMPCGGNIYIMCENMNLESGNQFHLPEGKYVHISFHDEGSGIVEEHLEKIFDPYFTTKEHGNGLGLATCYSIVKKHGGAITVESYAGLGTIFHLYLPASDKPVQRTNEKSAVNFSGKGRALVMDDEQDVRQVLGLMLKKLGYIPDFAVNGQEALKKYKKSIADSNPFDLVIMDLTIPGGMGGRETIEKLRAFKPDIKAIVSSGYCDDPVMANYTQYGFDGVVPKPVTYNQLCEAINKVFNDSQL